MIKRIFPFLRRTNVILFIALFSFSMLLLGLITYLYKMNVGDVILGYKNKNLETTAFLLMDDMKEHDIGGGVLTLTQKEWLHRRATLYGVMLKYQGKDEATPWFSTFDEEVETAGLIQAPYVRKGKVQGNVTVAYSSYQDELNPTYVHYMNVMKIRLRWLMSMIVVISGIFSFITAKFLSKHLSSLSVLANEISMEKRGITAPVRGPEEVRKLALALNDMSRELQKQEDWRQRLMEDLAHELRTPLTSMLSTVEAIIDGIFEPDEDRLNAIYEELERITRLLSDLQRLSEAESAQFTLNIKRINMVKLSRKVYENFYPQAKNKGIKITFESTNVPCYALVDPDKMTQVIANIVSNAVKYTSEGGRIILTVDWSEEHTVITCQDTGVGIKQQDVPYIFNRLYRADKSRSRFSGGVGLGLSIAKALAESHNSTIGVESQIGQGSIFTITIPNEI